MRPTSPVQRMRDRSHPDTKSVGDCLDLQTLRSEVASMTDDVLAHPSRSGALRPAFPRGVPAIGPRIAQPQMGRVHTVPHVAGMADVGPGGDRPSGELVGHAVGSSLLVLPRDLAVASAVKYSCPDPADRFLPDSGPEAKLERAPATGPAAGLLGPTSLGPRDERLTTDRAIVGWQPAFSLTSWEKCTPDIAREKARVRQ